MEYWRESLKMINVSQCCAVLQVIFGGTSSKFTFLPNICSREKPYNEFQYCCEYSLIKIF